MSKLISAQIKRQLTVRLQGEALIVITTSCLELVPPDHWQQFDEATWQSVWVLLGPPGSDPVLGLLLSFLPGSSEMLTPSLAHKHTWSLWHHVERFNPTKRWKTWEASTEGEGSLFCSHLPKMISSIIITLCAAELYLSDINPVAYDRVGGLGFFLCPLHVVWVVVHLENPDGVGCIKVKLSIVGFRCGRGGGKTTRVT